MMNIDDFITDDQDPKAVEKVLGKLQDLMTTGERILYMAVQKKPAVTLLPDCISVTNKRIFYCEPANLGLTMNFTDISWKNVKEVSFKEEFFGAKFICVPLHGENIVTEYIPKTQARKLHQAVNEQLERYKDALLKAEQEANTPPPVAPQAVAYTEPEPIVEVAPAEDETTAKLRRLKSLFDKQLITQEEYESKKASILDSI